VFRKRFDLVRLKNCSNDFTGQLWSKLGLTTVVVSINEGQTHAFQKRQIKNTAFEVQKNLSSC
jgi:hypothetical protein